ncbi:GNAT family N-acetyltransferase [Cellulomonas carbonis]|uniref:Acetyltransferase n=1 Tax=Cellulomonas carbonis T26 TaxID=947969 RepID=A0A0A0BWQ8_9CELL|nr:acetyltransferase [Cellulomonas carbonis T26]GGC03557.1 N-acetyltransferase [Cellulomonas carbonis]
MTAQGTGAVTLRRVEWTDPVAEAMRVAQQREVAGIYDGQGDLVQHLPTEQMLATVVADVDGEPAGCVALRADEHHGPSVGEVKRMYVRPEHRGRGLSRILLAEIHGLAHEHGLRRLVLETGDRLTAAIALYSSAGWTRIPNYGPYADEPTSLCFEYRLAPEA